MGCPPFPCFFCCTTSKWLSPAQHPSSSSQRIYKHLCSTAMVHWDYILSMCKTHKRKMHAHERVIRPGFHRDFWTYYRASVIFNWSFFLILVADCQWQGWSHLNLAQKKQLGAHIGDNIKEVALQAEILEKNTKTKEKHLSIVSSLPESIRGHFTYPIWKSITLPPRKVTNLIDKCI